MDYFSHKHPPFKFIGLRVHIIFRKNAIVFEIVTDGFMPIRKIILSFIVKVFKAKITVLLSLWLTSQILRRPGKIGFELPRCFKRPIRIP